MENKNFQMIDDSDLGNVTGGYLKVSEWVSFVSQEVIPVLYRLQSCTTGEDNAIVNEAVSIVRSTMVQGAAIAAPIQQLWSTYNVNYRNRMTNVQVRSELEYVLYSAKSYIDRNA